MAAKMSTKREWSVGDYKGIYKNSITHVYLNGEIIVEYNHCHNKYTYIKSKTQIPAYVATEILLTC